MEPPILPMNDPKQKYLGFHLLLFILLISLVGCSENSSADKVEDDLDDSNTESVIDSLRKGNTSNNIEKWPKQKRMPISKEGMIDTIKVDLYLSPKHSPLQFALYFPSELHKEEIPDDGFTLNLIRNEALLQLHIFPKNVESFQEAKDLSRKIIEPLGKLKEMDNGYQLISNGSITSSIELYQEKGIYYYWWKKYPVEYGDGFGAEVYFIKENMRFIN